MKKGKVTIACAALLFLSCYIAPMPVYHLQPVPETGVWMAGKQYVTEDIDDLKLVIAFDKSLGGTVQFQVEVLNGGDRAVLIAPEESFLVNHWTMGVMSVSDTIMAIDPEREILDTQTDLSEEYADYYSSKGNRSISALLDLIVDVGEIGRPKTAEEQLAEENEDLQREEDALRADMKHNQDMQSLNHYLSRWENNALRKTTLPGGYLIRGNLYFPAPESIEKADLHIKIESRVFVFHFSNTTEEYR